jgi:predicted nucleic acid-binding protein
MRRPSRAFYLDTSALLKIYILETGTQEVRELVRKADLIFISRIAYLEFHSAISRKALEGEKDWRETLKNFKSDWENGFYNILEMSDYAIDRASSLALMGIEKGKGVRAYDALHCGMASIVLEELKIISEKLDKDSFNFSFVTSDSRQKEAANWIGLPVRYVGS